MAKQIIRGDRRFQRRYPIELDLEYKIIRNNKVISSGFGKTGNLSSGGLFFQAPEGVPSAPTIELSVRWPAVLGHVPFIELCISGRLVRNDARGIAVRMSRYHFQRLADTRAAFEELFTDAVIQ